MANLQQYWNRAAAAAGTRSKPFRVWGRALAYLLAFSFASGAATGPLNAQGIKISALPAASSANAGDELPANQSGTTRKLTTAQIVALLSGGSGIGIASNVISTASNEADFLISGALTCGASTQGKVQTHSTTPLQYCDNAATPTLRYAAYGNASGECLASANDSVALTTDTTGGYAASVSEAGPATTASAAVSDPANCSAGSVAGGVDASWIGQDCLDPITETELDSLAELNTQLTTTIADGPHTVDTDDQTAAEVVYTPIDATDWTDPDPDDVADGLDKVVDRLKAEEGKADDDVPESGDFGALALTGPVTSSGVATSIANDAITEAMLKSVNASTDEFCLTREDTTGDFEWQACGGVVNSFETITASAGDPVVADSATDSLSISCGNGIFCNGNAASDQIGFGTASYEANFLSDLDTTDLTCGTDAVGKAGVLDNGKFQYCDGNDTSVLRSGYLDADGTDDDLPDADEIVESMLKAVDAAVDEECLTYETTTGDFEWQTCAVGGSGDVVGPASATDNAIARFDSTTGKLIQDSDISVSDVSASSVTVATSAGNALALAATPPTATTGASQAGKAASLAASSAVASTDTAGAAVGGSINLTAGAAARNTSGNAGGGSINLTPGSGIGTGISGQVRISTGSAAVGSATAPALALGTAETGLSADAFSGVLLVAAGQTGSYYSGGGMRVQSDGQYFFTGSSTDAGTPTDSGLKRVTAAVLGFTNGSSGGGWYQWSGQCRVVSNQTSSTTTFASTTCTISNLVAGRKYPFRCWFSLDQSTAADGAKFDFAGGTATETSFRASGTLYDTTLALAAHVDDLTDTIAVSTLTGLSHAEVFGDFVPSGAGTFIPRFAENGSTVGDLTLHAGSWCTMDDSP